MASFLEKMEYARQEWKKTKPCDTRLCPAIDDQKYFCRGPCHYYAAWLASEPIGREIKWIEEKLNQLIAEQDTFKRTLAGLIELKTKHLEIKLKP